jgi:hypothetical protein
MKQTTLPRPDLRGTGQVAFAKKGKPSPEYRAAQLRVLEAYYTDRLIASAVSPRNADCSAHFAQRAELVRLIRVARQSSPDNRGVWIGLIKQQRFRCKAENDHCQKIREMNLAPSY